MGVHPPGSARPGRSSGLDAFASPRPAPDKGPVLSGSPAKSRAFSDAPGRETAHSSDGYRPARQRRPPRSVFPNRPRRHGGSRRQGGGLSAIANAASQILHDLGGQHTLLRSPANGGRPVALYVPPRVNPTKPLELVLFFHGKGGRLDEILSQGGIAAEIRKWGVRHPNSLFVLPQGHRSNGRDWMSSFRGESFGELLREVSKAAAKLLQTGKLERGGILLRVHSTGGAALENALDAGELEADRIEIWDGLQGDLPRKLGHWAQDPQNAKSSIAIVYTPYQQGRVRSLRKILGNRTNFRIERSRFGHGQIPRHYWCR